MLKIWNLENIFFKICMFLRLGVLFSYFSHELKNKELLSFCKSMWRKSSCNEYLPVMFKITIRWENKHLSPVSKTLETFLLFKRLLAVSPVVIIVITKYFGGNLLANAFAQLLPSLNTRCETELMFICHTEKSAKQPYKGIIASDANTEEEKET